MLEGLRKGIGGLATKILLGLLIVSFAVWGIADVFRGFGAQTVARIGSTEIRQELYRRAFTERVQALGRQIGRGLTNDEARKYGIDRQVLGELIYEAALDEKAQKLGLAISDPALADRVRDQQIFKGPDGTFNPIIYRNVLQNNNYSEATYLAAERRAALREQITRALSGDIVAPTVMRDAMWRYTNETRAIEFVRLTRAQAGEIPAPSENDLKAYFDANKASFRAPEYRSLRVIYLSPADIAATVQVTDDELKKAYEGLIPRFTTPERRQIEQVSFPSPDMAKTAAERIAKGEKLEAVAKDLKLDIVSLGLVARNDIIDPAVGDAAFALAANAVSAPVLGRFGTSLVRVSKIEPTRVRPLEEVSKPLREDLSLQQAFRRVQELHDKIEDEKAAGLTLQEISEKLKVPVTTIEAVDSSGRKPDATPASAIPSFDQVLNGAFAVQKNVETDAIELRESRSTIWYEVADIKPARERTFDEARKDVEARWRDELASKKLAEQAEAIRAKLDGGAAFAAAAPNLKAEKAEGLRRNAPAQTMDANTLTRVFLTNEGKAAISTAQNGVDRLIFRVTSVTVPQGEVPAALSQQLVSSLREDLLAQYAERLQTDLGLRVNEAALRQVTGADTRN